MISENKSIEIYVLYSPLNSYEYSFFEIVNENMPLAVGDYEPSGFWGINGGLEIVINGYCSIFRSTDFHYLVRATSFLLQSLYWLKGEKSHWFDVDDDYPDDVSVRTTGRNVLLLKNIDESNVELSFISANNESTERGLRYFNNIVINKDQWCSAVHIALSEYFEMLLAVVKNNLGDETNKTMINYYNVWQAIYKR